MRLNFLPFPARPLSHIPAAAGSCSLALLLLAGAQAAYAQQAQPDTAQIRPLDKETAAAADAKSKPAEARKAQGIPDSPEGVKPAAVTTKEQQIQVIDDQIRALEARKAALLGTTQGPQSRLTVLRTPDAALSPSGDTRVPQGKANPPEKPGPDKPAEVQSGPFQVNGQLTWIVQNLFKFHSPYQFDSSGVGGGSLLSRNEAEISQTYTLYLGARVKRNLEVYIDPEMARGHGVSNAVGVAGYTNGEVIRNPTLSQDPYLARYYVKYIVPTGKGEEKVEPGQNQVTNTRPTHRLTFWAGKMGVSDIFDLNAYANSTRTQFMNWALLNNGAYDYAADTRGYTRGIAVEWINPSFAVRLGSFQMPTVANGIDLAGNIGRNRGDQIELELHPRLLPVKSPATVRLLAYRNVAHMGDYRKAVAMAQQAGATPDITKAESDGSVKYGFGLNFEAPLGDDGDTGLFGRYSWDDGATESFAYTEIDRALSLGAQISGKRWRRPLDRFGIAFVQNDLSGAHKDYLATGGAGFILGDGRLNYAPEQILEAYYNFQFNKFVGFSTDYQYITNPGYNQDRGPASLLSGRLHLEF